MLALMRHQENYLYPKLKKYLLEAVRVRGEKGGASISSNDASLQDCPIFSGVVKSTYKLEVLVIHYQNL